MAQFVLIPLERMNAEALAAMLEEYATRDGTDYGGHERALGDKVASLRRQLIRGDLSVVYEVDSEQWDLLDRQRVGELDL